MKNEQTDTTHKKTKVKPDEMTYSFTHSRAELIEAKKKSKVPSKLSLANV